MFKLCKIDLMDTYIWADVFEDDTYKLVAETPNLDHLYG